MLFFAGFVGSQTPDLRLESILVRIYMYVKMINLKLVFFFLGSQKTENLKAYFLSECAFEKAKSKTVLYIYIYTNISYPILNQFC